MMPNYNYRSSIVEMLHYTHTGCVMEVYLPHDPLCSFGQEFTLQCSYTCFIYLRFQIIVWSSGSLARREQEDVEVEENVDEDSKLVLARTALFAGAPPWSTEGLIEELDVMVASRCASCWGNGRELDVEFFVQVSASPKQNKEEAN